MKESADFNEWLIGEYGQVITSVDPTATGITGESNNQMQAAYDLLQMIINWAYYEGGTDKAVSILDKVYSNPDNRRYSILEVLLVEYKKQWWVLED